MEKKYLPIGSVCTLKGKNKKVMITGYYSIDFNGNLKINDYCGCVYPEGELLSEQKCNFNHSDIEKVDFIGYKNEEEIKFMRLFNQAVGNDSDASNNEQHASPNDMVLASSKSYSKLLFDENGVVMIADAIEPKPVVEQKKIDNIKFDKEGYVVSVLDESDVENPFRKKYESREIKESTPEKWKIFDNIEFDEEGTVINDNVSTQSLDKSKLSNIEFDENGVVIAVNSETLKSGKYIFDEEGTIISVIEDGNE